MSLGYVLELIVFPGVMFIFSLSLLIEWLDRKLFARFQHRMGPAYVGPYGLLQPLADLLKLLSKEDITPNSADKFLFNSMPMIYAMLSLYSCFFLPVTASKGLVSFQGDLVFIVALLTLISIVSFVSGYVAYNRFSLVGAERAAIQLIAFEIPLTLSLVSVGIGAGSFHLMEIVDSQRASFNIVGPGLLGFIVYLIASQAELERQPFDTPEAEQELVAGWMVEYSGRKYALFRLGRDLELLFLSGLGAALFLGGPLGPYITGFERVLAPIYFTVKTLVVLFLLSAIKAAMARLRIDQIVSISWKYLLPVSIIQIIMTWVMRFA